MQRQPLRILHIFSSNLYTGAVAYALSLAQIQREGGNIVFLAHDPGPIPGLISSGGLNEIQTLFLPVHDRRMSSRLQAVLALRTFLLREHIQIVHAHSRAASWLATLATLGTSASLISTVHGRQGKGGTKKLFNKGINWYGKRIVAVCENLAIHLASELGLPPSKIQVLVNGLPPQLPPSDIVTENPDQILVAGRFSGPKGIMLGHWLKNILEPVLAANPAYSCVVAGGQLSDLPLVAQQTILKLQAHYPFRLSIIGFVADLPARISASGMVVGAGRVALEALIAGKSVFAIGEATSHGFVTDENLEACKSSNFGDVWPKESSPEVDFAALAGAMLPKFSKPWQTISEAARFQLAHTYSLPHVAEQILALYHNVLTEH
jgi:glycosyltransferase involved in cell wall biosynthesis